MPLHPQAAALIEQINAAPAPTVITPELARENLRQVFSIPGEVVGAARDFTIPGADASPMPARAYTPAGADASVLPVVLYLHGGGWVAGDLVAYDALCRALCNASGCLLVAIEYRLAPEHPYPAAVEDCLAALRWLASNADELGGDTARIALAGDSAGGNLAAVLALLARDEGLRLKFQLLVYPVTDCNLDTASYLELAEGYLLTREGMRWNWDNYLADPALRTAPTASPLRWEELSGVAPALVITAGYDPLRDEGEAYARRLQSAGVPTELRRYAGMVHAFFSLGHVLDEGREAVLYAGAALQRALNAP